MTSPCTNPDEYSTKAILAKASIGKIDDDGKRGAALSAARNADVRAMAILILKGDPCAISVCKEYCWLAPLKIALGISSLTSKKRAYFENEFGLLSESRKKQKITGSTHQNFLQEWRILREKCLSENVFGSRHDFEPLAKDMEAMRSNVPAPVLWKKRLPVPKGGRYGPAPKNVPFVLKTGLNRTIFLKV